MHRLGLLSLTWLMIGLMAGNCGGSSSTTLGGDKDGLNVGNVDQRDGTPATLPDGLDDGDDLGETHGSTSDSHGGEGSDVQLGDLSAADSLASTDSADVLPGDGEADAPTTSSDSLTPTDSQSLDSSDVTPPPADTVDAADSAAPTDTGDSQTSPEIAENHPPQGGITIVGPISEGATLQVDSNGLTDADGLGPFSYRWERADSDAGPWTPIDGASSDSYLVTTDDVGKVIRVIVSYTDGKGTAETVTSPVQQGLRFVQLSAGGHHTCGRTAAGTIYCWGNDDYGQLGDDANFSVKAVPVLVDSSGLNGARWASVAAGLWHTCALTGAGKAYCWGRDDEGQLGNDANLSNSPTPVPVDTSLSGTARFVSLVIGGYHTCGLTATGAAYCWGRDIFGQLGNDGVIESKATPVAVNIALLNGQRFVALTAGRDHTCGLTGRGNAFCWGYDNEGQLGDDAPLVHNREPKAVEMTALNGDRFVSLRAGRYHTCGRTAEGRLFCWGRDVEGQLGDDAAFARKTTPVLVDATALNGRRWMALSVGRDHSCGLSSERRAYCWGWDQYGQLGNDTNTTSLPTPVSVDVTALGSSHFVALTAGEQHTCGLTEDGRAFCWGGDTDGQLGNDAAFSKKTTPVPVFDSAPTGARLRWLSTGGGHSCALSVTGASYCWGDDTAGQLGDDALFATQKTPVPVTVPTVLGGRLLGLTVGTAHSCGHTPSGLVLCWGSDDAGQLGNGEPLVGSPTPVQVGLSALNGEPLVSLALGGHHSCGLRADGLVFCWGGDGDGQLGDNLPLLNRSTMVAVDGTGLNGERLTQISAGARHTCGIGDAGNGYCWGANDKGQLGIVADVVNSPLPAPVEPSGLAGLALVRIVAGGAHSCALTTVGTVYCWGDDLSGQLGDDANIATQKSPVLVDLTLLGERRVVALAAGDRHTCGLIDEGSVICWGDASDGQLGNGLAAPNQPTPVAVDLSPLNGERVIALRAGGTTTCALTETGQIWCWGSNLVGQLGDGQAPQSSASPVRVSLF